MYRLCKKAKMTIRMTPTQRAELHKVAKNAPESGKFNGFSFKLLPKLDGAHELDEERIAATKGLASVIFPEFPEITFTLYQQLLVKLGHIYGCRVVVKGSSALALYFMGTAMQERFPFSDVDIVIYADKKHKSQIKMIVGQTIAKHKQTIDRMFFTGGGYDTDLFRERFAQKHIEHYGHLSPLASIDARNDSSSYSYYITNATDPTKVVKIIEPHFDFAEKIPLDKTPLFCSVNDTLGDIDLYRMKWGMRSESGKFVQADFIDIIVDCSDCPVIKGVHEFQRVDRFGYVIYIPTIKSMMFDLEQLIPVLESKRVDRQAKFDMLTMIQMFENHSSLFKIGIMKQINGNA
jgi:hypothetical protein